MFFKSAYAGLGLPLQGSDVAVAYDNLYGFLFWLSVFFFVLVVGGMIYLAIKYRRREGIKTKYIIDNHALEIFWTAIPTVLLLGIFGWGWAVYRQQVTAPADAMEVRVVGRQWAWSFQYDDGRVTAGELYVPLNKPVKLVMSSEDVLHSFFIPNFRVKQDVVPGMYTSVWFEATVPGAHQVFCTEYCGASHSLMLAKVFVLEPQKWADWKKGKKVEVTGAVAQAGGADTTQQTLSVESLPEQGQKLTEAKGCLACHSADGTPKATGPSWKGIFGKEIELTDGSKVKADENYIRESILKPQVKVVKGFNPVMPPFQGMLSEQELNAVVAYVKSLK